MKASLVLNTIHLVIFECTTPMRELEQIPTSVYQISCDWGIQKIMITLVVHSSIVSLACQQTRSSICIDVGQSK